MHRKTPHRITALAFCMLLLLTLHPTSLAADSQSKRRADFIDELSAMPHYDPERAERYLRFFDSEEYSAEQVLRMVNVNADAEVYKDYAETDVSKGELMLVNKHNYLGRYKPEKLSPLGRYGSWGSLASQARDAFAELVDAAASEGRRIWTVSPYRSFDMQEYLYDGYVKAHGREEADTYSARPGWSEHQTGLAVDVAVRGKSYGEFEGTPECDWMRRHAHEYGFILRYGEGVEYITGYIYEPWHYRYVGVEAATYIYEHDLTFEEYYYYYVVGDEPMEAPAERDVRAEN